MVISPNDLACARLRDEAYTFTYRTIPMVKTVHKAGYVLADSNCLLRDAAVGITGTGAISSVGSRNDRSGDPGTEDFDWGTAVIIPGLINAHAHLELTSLHGRVTRFESFTDWLAQLIAQRRSWEAEDFIASAGEGARQSLAAGTTLVGDITSSGVGWRSTAGQRLRRVVFEEVLALSPDRALEAMQQLNSRFDLTKPNPLLLHGISPHAPYSVSPELYLHSARLAQKRGMTLATHLAETRSELDLLRHGTGEFIDFLKAADVLPNGWAPPKTSPVGYLDRLEILSPSCLLVHCNYLDQESIDTIRNRQAHVVYCPRSHAFFGHEEHPIRQLMDAGINVALGTDSLASNSSVSILDEMRFLYGRRKDLKSGEIFQAATVGGARALNLGRVLGCLKPGYWADMAILRLPGTIKSGRILEQILEGAGECIATIVQGEIAWEKQEWESKG